MFGFEDMGTAIFWGAIVLIVLMSFVFGHLRRTAKYRMIERLAEKGQTLTPELLASVGGNGDREYRRGGAVPSGIFLMCIGVALAVFFWALTGGGNPFVGDHISWLPVIGIFPFMVGLARVLGGAVERHEPK